MDVATLLRGALERAGAERQSGRDAGARAIFERRGDAAGTVTWRRCTPAETQAREELRRISRERRAAQAAGQHSSYKAIPRFYSKVHAMRERPSHFLRPPSTVLRARAQRRVDSDEHHMLVSLARARKLRIKAQEIVSPDVRCHRGGRSAASLAHQRVRAGRVPAGRHAHAHELAAGGRREPH